MMKFKLILSVMALALSSCATAGRVGGGVTTAVTVYCIGVSETGKQAIRAVLTGGQKILACPAGTTATVAQ
jgi:hypothetical protein